MPAEKKPWGRMEPLAESDDQLRQLLRPELITINAGGYSSIHQHTRQHNIFQVLSGVLIVRTFGLLPDQTIRMLHERKIATPMPIIFPAGELHQFFAVTDVTALEIYLPFEPGQPPRLDDIVRYTTNGMSA